VARRPLTTSTFLQLSPAGHRNSLLRISLSVYMYIRILAYSAICMSLQLTNQRMLKLQSEICKMLSNPKRLQILHALRNGEKTVTELCTATGVKQANVSQHLALMRQRNMVKERRVGNTVFYQISDDRISKACDIMRTVLIDQANEDSKLVQLATASRRQ
jgi:DNA-binding transcriptional ArsR family regulator